ncbi:hypothetical protein Dsin_004024 [Dipteronia sinensis]|uniref:Uncharacterized protein n=1 Tax=Dipteronia sinensis TaxID=43782 RepID=A0AAE0BA30_9ROSI|nr:hypothetical protein Dsin_004024 [Dipteronia sinensis]
MEYPNYEEALKKARGLVMRLEEEIGDKNQQLIELEHELSDTKAAMLELIVGLTEKVTARDRELLVLEQSYKDEIISRDRRLFELEQICRESSAAATVRQLMDEKTKLHEEYTKGNDSNLNDQIAALRDQLEEKTEALQYLESLNNTLTVKESVSNQELQDARKESISEVLLAEVYIWKFVKYAPKLLFVGTKLGL